jgi:predicted transcriptional regulator
MERLIQATADITSAYVKNQLALLTLVSDTLKGSARIWLDVLEEFKTTKMTPPTAIHQVTNDDQ